RGGFLQGGGYGSFSKRFGSGAGGVLEFEVVTADGSVLVANKAQNADLFWALRGGGGGTFGIVTRVALRAHEPPQTIGLAHGTIQAPDEATFRELLSRFVAFYPGALNNPHWGEQLSVRGDNSLQVYMTFLDLDEAAAKAVWQPLLDDLPAGARADLAFDVFRFSDLWDLSAWQETDPDFVRVDTRPEALPNHYWWASNQGEVSQFLNTYQSRWLPLSLFAPDRAGTLARALFQASRHAPVSMHFNKGLSGAPADVLAREAEETSINPLVREAATLVIIASNQAPVFPGIPGHEPDLARGRAARGRIQAAIDILREATPGGGTYANEADYFEPDWQRSFYGEHYDRLLEIKRKYDPGNLFRVHHGVGSDG
ncbi:BBE domain-containing protein, partial [Microbaculum marinum]|uniref:BBE domain-containing protein n=1 Tax=Microbaculum marinum TaxID=1764581 RepID=UPI00361AECA3